MPYKPDERWYRAFDMAPVDGADGGYVVEGYATTFDAPYDFGPDGVKECVRATALEGADMSDVIFQLNHTGIPMARLRNGTLELTPDAHGLRVRADLGGCRAGRELHEAIRSGLVSQMSWGFTVPPGGWEYDRETRTSYVSRITKVFDVSAVSIPANADTELHARSYLDGAIEAERQELSRRDRERRRRAALRIRLL